MYEKRHSGVMMPRQRQSVTLFLIEQDCTAWVQQLICQVYDCKALTASVCLLYGLKCLTMCSWGGSKGLCSRRRKENTMPRTIAHQQATVPRTYRVEEIAEILGIGRSSAYKLVQQGQFKVVRIGSSIRISRSSFDSWLEAQEQ